MSAVLAPPAAAAATDQAAGMIATGMCSTQARELADKPIARIAETIELTGDQRLALDELRTALGQAVDRGRAVVCGTASSAPTDRLKRMLDGLWTMWDAAILMRAPLEALRLAPPAQRQWGGAPTDTNAAGDADWPADRIRTRSGAGGRRRVGLLRAPASLRAGEIPWRPRARRRPRRRRCAAGAVSDRMNAP
jgi:hypothetical protein